MEKNNVGLWNGLTGQRQLFLLATNWFPIHMQIFIKLFAWVLVNSLRPPSVMAHKRKENSKSGRFQKKIFVAMRNWQKIHFCPTKQANSAIIIAVKSFF